MLKLINKQNTQNETDCLENNLNSDNYNDKQINNKQEEDLSINRQENLINGENELNKKRGRKIKKEQNLDEYDFFNNNLNIFNNNYQNKLKYHDNEQYITKRTSSGRLVKMKILANDLDSDDDYENDGLNENKILSKKRSKSK